MGISYKDAGVDIDKGNEAVQLMKEHVKSTFNDGVLTDIGGFGGLFRPDHQDQDHRDPGRAEQRQGRLRQR